LVDDRAGVDAETAMLNGGHFDAYEADFERSAGAAVDWFKEPPVLVKRLRKAMKQNAYAETEDGPRYSATRRT
jgi:hypothetical protein